MPDSRLEFKVQGMDCAEEVTLLRQELSPLVGGDSRLAFDILSRKMIVTAPAGLAENEIIRAVARTPMRAEPWRGADAPMTRPASFWERYGRTLLTAVSGA